MGKQGNRDVGKWQASREVVKPGGVEAKKWGCREAGKHGIREAE